MNKILFLSSVILGVVFVILLLTTFSSNAYACMCISPEPTEQFMMQSEYAFVGTVNTIDNPIGPQLVLFDIELDLKENIEGEKFLLTNTHVILQPDNSTILSSCDARFKVGNMYHVFVIDGTADMCTATITGYDERYVVQESYNYFPMIFVAIGIVIFSLYIWKKR